MSRRRSSRRRCSRRVKQRAGTGRSTVRQTASCSPLGQQSSIPGSCLNASTARALVDAMHLTLRRSHSSQPTLSTPNVATIPSRDTDTSNTDAESMQMVELLRSQSKESCSRNEFCVVKHSNISPSLKQRALERFAPLAPLELHKDKNAWLSNIDIDKVMTQYEHIHGNFRFIGPTPIDFDKPMSRRRKMSSKKQCICNRLCNFSLQSYLEEHVDKIGIIFNLDTNDMPGSHWVSMFVSLERDGRNDRGGNIQYENKNPLVATKCSVVYFDSTGESPPIEIQRLAGRIEKQAATLRLGFSFLDIGKTHQQHDTECGMYALYFVSNMITRPREILRILQTEKVSDKTMEDLRAVYFNYDPVMLMQQPRHKKREKTTLRRKKNTKRV
jgi:Ulp1 protease family, C-terminal catalytic domain